MSLPYLAFWRKLNLKETVLKESKHNSLPQELMIHQSEDTRVLELAKENKRRHVAYMKWNLIIETKKPWQTPVHAQVC